jgi:hypothetical protein
MNHRLDNEILRGLHFYMGSMNILDAFERAKQDAASLEDLAVVEATLFPEVVSLLAAQFAEKYQSLAEGYQYEPDLDTTFQIFCKVEGIEESLGDQIASAINFGAMIVEEDDDNFELPTTKKNTDGMIQTIVFSPQKIGKI